MPQSLPGLSVIVAAFNEEKYLRECLLSITRQDLRNIEIIIVDDASSDESPLILNKFASTDERVRVITNVENLGLGESRNLGIRNARGEYVIFLDADDSLLPHSLDHLYTIAIDNNSDVVIGKMVSEVNVDGNYIKRDLVNTTLFESPELLYNHSALNKIIRKKLLLKNRILFEPPKYAEDIYFSIRSNYHACTISITTKPTYNYRWGRQLNNVTRAKLEDARSNIFRSLAFIEHVGGTEIINRMRTKVARNAFSIMARANRVYSDNDIEKFLKPWQPVLSNMPTAIFSNIPDQHVKFCRLVICGDFKRAFNFAQDFHAKKKSRAGIFTRIESIVARKLSEKKTL